MRRTRTDSDEKRITVISDDEDTSYCDLCDASNGYCGKIYNADSVKKHHTKLGPMKETEAPELVPLDLYAHFNPSTQKHKQKNPVDYEDEKMFKPRAGYSITSKEDFFPES
jgi:hypothetical protein